VSSAPGINLILAAIFIKKSGLGANTNAIMPPEVVSAPRPKTMPIKYASWASRKGVRKLFRCKLANVGRRSVTLKGLGIVKDRCKALRYVPVLEHIACNDDSFSIVF